MFTGYILAQGVAEEEVRAVAESLCADISQERAAHAVLRAAALHYGEVVGFFAAGQVLSKFGDEMLIHSIAPTTLPPRKPKETT